MSDANRRSRGSRVLTGLSLFGVWLVVALGTAVVLFLGSHRATVIASHEAVISPTLDGKVTLHSGPFLPDLRMESDAPVGVEVQLGKTVTDSVPELIQRYALLATNPQGQISKTTALVTDLAVSAAVRGAVLALLPVGLWLLLGPERRRLLFRRARRPVGLATVLVVVLLGVVAWQPWRGTGAAAAQQDQKQHWTSLRNYLPEISVPDDIAGIEVRTDVTTDETRRLLQSLVDTYERGQEFYAEALADVETIAGELRDPEEGETVAVLVADRHDNIGMDPIARAIGDAAGATVVLDAGDDTSTGEPWEAFSLDSLNEAFEDYERYAVAGNHDNGPFVTEYLSDLGWTTPHLEVVPGPGDSDLLGADDPRSSGLGTWRDAGGPTTFAEQEEELADIACAAEDRIETLLVHDPNIGSTALERGCVDLVVGGHHHVRTGPEIVIGENGRRGYTYTTGTAGGAAYAIAVGSKLRRPAVISLITYADGRPAGIQWVRLQTNGVFEVGQYVELELEPPVTPEGPRIPGLTISPGQSPEEGENQ